MHLRIPGGRGGIIWNRPASVLVIAADGTEQVVRIPDRTRQVVWGSLGAAVITWLVYKLMLHKKRRDHV